MALLANTSHLTNIIPIPIRWFGIHELFLFLFVQKLAPRIYSYSYLRGKLLFPDHSIRPVSLKLFYNVHGIGPAGGRCGSSFIPLYIYSQKYVELLLLESKIH